MPPQSPQENTDGAIQAIAESLTTYIATDDSRARFEGFRKAVPSSKELAKLCREAEAERLLSGSGGTALTRTAVGVVCSSSDRAQGYRNDLFFAVAEMLSSRKVNLAVRPARPTAVASA